MVRTQKRLTLMHVITRCKPMLRHVCVTTVAPYCDSNCTCIRLWFERASRLLQQASTTQCDCKSNVKFADRLRTNVPNVHVLSCLHNDYAHGAQQESHNRYEDTYWHTQGYPSGKVTITMSKVPSRQLNVVVVWGIRQSCGTFVLLYASSLGAFGAHSDTALSACTKSVPLAAALRRSCKRCFHLLKSTGCECLMLGSCGKRCICQCMQISNAMLHAKNAHSSTHSHPQTWILDT